MIYRISRRIELEHIIYHFVFVCGSLASATLPKLTRNYVCLTLCVHIAYMPANTRCVIMSSHIFTKMTTTTTTSTT